MDLIELKCKKCGGDLQVNSELSEITCNFCGTKMLIDDAATEYARLEKAKLEARKNMHEQEMMEMEDFDDYHQEQAIREMEAFDNYVDDKRSRRKIADACVSIMWMPLLLGFFGLGNPKLLILSIVEICLLVFTILLCKKRFNDDLNKHYKLVFLFSVIFMFICITGFFFL